MQQQLTTLQETAIQEIQQATNTEMLEQLRILYLGRKDGKITHILRGLGSLPEEERPMAGQLANQVKNAIAQALKQQQDSLSGQIAAVDAIDVTLPGKRPEIGNLHPLTIVRREIEDVFISMGFEIVSGPEVETEFYNFDALNTPPDHPSRDMRDTFYLSSETLLRTETSTMQIRTMEKRQPPIRILAPGRCYRNDTLDATHSPIFRQVECLCVDEGITFADLKGTLNAFAKKMFGNDVRSRFRPHFFPFTEPSAEIDISCFLCGGKGCRVCKNTGWIEMGGSGMVDPNVFRSVGYDSEKYSGFAFGLGIERIAMFRYGIQDIRLFAENDLRFLKQFK